MPDASNTRINIYNKALAKIKVAGVTSVDQQCEPVRKCNLFYDCARKSALRACDWRWAGLKMPLILLGSVDVMLANPGDLSKSDVIPPWNYTYAYPPGVIRIRKIFNAQHGEEYPMWHDRSGNGLHDQVNRWEESRSPYTNKLALACNLPFAWAEVTLDITDESQFDDMFQDALAWALAEELCIPLSCDMELKQSVEADAEKIFSEAKRKNGGEGVEMLNRTSNYEAARNGGDRLY